MSTAPVEGIEPYQPAESGQLIPAPVIQRYAGLRAESFSVSFDASGITSFTLEMPNAHAITERIITVSFMPTDPTNESPTVEEADESWDDYDDEWECTWCNGDALVEGKDPGWDYGEIVPCDACNGTGLRKHQTIF